jgi:hypothetical protein
MFRTASLMALALVAVAPAAQAQTYYAPRPAYAPYYGPPTVVVRPRPDWWYAGVGVVGTSILGQSGGPEQLQSGGGLSAWIGVNVARELSLELGWLGSFHNPATIATYYGPTTDYLVLDGLTADAKVHLGRSGIIDPFLQGGVGLYFLGSQHSGYADSVGPGYQLGGGVDFRVSPIVSLGARALYRGISMGPPDGTVDDTFIHALTVEGSLAFHF